MGEAPHEIYTDAEKKARAEPVCGNCKWWVQYFEDTTLGVCDNTFMDARSNRATIVARDPVVTTNDFGCIHFEPKT